MGIMFFLQRYFLKIHLKWAWTEFFMIYLPKLCVEAYGLLCMLVCYPSNN